MGGQLLGRGGGLNGAGDPALAGEGAGGGGQRLSVVHLSVGAGAHEGVLILRAVGGGGQRIPGQGGYDGAPLIGERGRGGGGGRRALVASFFLQELFLGRSGGGGAGFEHRDTTLPAGGVFPDGGSADWLFRGRVFFLLELRLCRAARGIIGGVFQIGQSSVTGSLLQAGGGGEAVVGWDGAERRARRGRRGHTAPCGALSFAVASSNDGGVRRCPRLGEFRVAGGGRLLVLLSLSSSITAPLQEETLRSRV